MGIAKRLNNIKMNLMIKDLLNKEQIEDLDKATIIFTSILSKLKEVRDKKNGMNYKTIDNEDLEHLIKLIEE